MKISDAIFQFKHRLIKGALQMNGGNVSATARMLGMHRNNLRRWIEILGLQEFTRETVVQRTRRRLAYWRWQMRGVA